MIRRYRRYRLFAEIPTGDLSSTVGNGVCFVRTSTGSADIECPDDKLDALNEYMDAWGWRLKIDNVEEVAE